MALIVGGVMVAGYGLLPKTGAHRVPAGVELHVSAPEDAPMVAAYWRLMVVLTITLAIDVTAGASCGSSTCRRAWC